MNLLTCSTCNLELPEDRFSRKNDRPSGRSSRCKDCHNTYVREVWYVKNRQKQIDATSKWKRKNKAKVLATQYGTSVEHMEELLGKDECDICGSSDTILYIDHCHTTGKVRGRLCPQCNFGIGNFKDDVDKMRSAIVYLEKHS